MIETEALIQAAAMLVVVFLGMRVLYGSWPWEGRKTWYATRRLLPVVEKDEEGTALSPEQVAHAVASAASIAKNQLEDANGSEISSQRENRAA